MLLTPETIRTELKQVIDPEVMLNIVDMGLVYGIDIADTNDITVTMTLTTPHCPMGPEIVDNVKRTAGGVIGAGDVSVNIIWEPPWTPNMFSDELKEEMRALGMEFDEDIISKHEPEPPVPPPPPKPKKRGLVDRILGR